MAKRNPRGSGSIRHRPDGTWEGRYSYQDEFGRSKRRSIYAKTQQECRKKLTAILKERDEGTLRTSEDRYTVEEWMKQWLKLYCGFLKPNTIHTYQSRMERDIFPYIGHLPLTQLKNQQIQLLMNSLYAGDETHKPLSGKTVVCVHGILHTALQQAVILGILAANPSDHVKLPKIYLKLRTPKQPPMSSY